MFLRARPSIVLFGDSITQEAFGSADGSITGWASLLSTVYSRRADVYNRGFAGYNSRHGFQLLPRLLPTTTTSTSSSAQDSGNTLYWTIFFGANDATLPGQRQHVPLEEYCDNVEKMVDMIRKSHGAVPKFESNQESHQPVSSSPVDVILITPPPVDPQGWEDFCLKNYGERRGKRDLNHVKKYALKLKEVGKKLNCPVLDLFEIFEKSENKDFFYDGLHLSSLGNRLVFEGLMELVKKDFPSKSPEEEGGVKLEEKLWSELC